MTDVAGSSGWFDCGYVTYSNAAKMRDLRVSQQTLATPGAVSAETVRAMALTAPRGPAARPDAAPPRGEGFAGARPQAFEAGREFIRRQSVEFALELVLQLDLP